MASGVSGYVDFTSGSFTVRVHYSETYDITSNSSTITITNAQLASSSYYGWSYYPSGSITVNGTTAVTCSSSLGSHYAYVPAANTFYNITASSSSYSSPPWSGGTVTHNDDGSKNIEIAVNFNIWTLSGGGGSGANVSGSKTISLTTIPRKSTLSVSNGTLGTAQTLTVTRKHSSFTHTITYSCGSASGTICSNSSSTSISWTPPLNLANQVPSATAALCGLTITTYNGSTNIGSNSYSITLTLPSSIKPSVSISVSDAMGYASTYGGYIKGLSKFKIALTATTSYSSAIASYSITANGTKYSSSSVTTGAITTSGTNTISASVTDNRGRSGSSSTTATVLDYTYPSITLLKVNRCDSDGTENNQGEYVKVTYSGTVTSLSSKNTAKWILYYKKTSDSSYSSVTLSTGTTYSMSNKAYVVAADSGSSYDIKLSVTDNFSTTSKETVASTAFTMMHFNDAGNGMAIGKVSETENILDVALETRFENHICMPNNHILRFYNASGGYRNVITLNSSNDYAFGYGSYQYSEGATKLYGNTIYLSSKNAINVNQSLLFSAYSKGLSWTLTNGKIQLVSMSTGESLNLPYIASGSSSWTYNYLRITPGSTVAFGTGSHALYLNGSAIYINSTQMNDFVVAKGTSGIWTYRKWNSGIAECWGRKSNNVTVTSTWGNIYCCDNAIPSVTFPFTFTNEPIVSATPFRNTGGNYWLYTNGNTSGATPFYGIARGSAYSSTLAATVDLYVVGTWK